ncbi:hypothetical protein B0H17DRAFT_1220010 [Mycena rosella]|uniref:Uncharacterized protein n=1 Tax=Mycena rosella TaxID=1033263 RepID=A0AAD7FG66_MYCRO|nr:hypothetical protein B0H17DRAFT_1220010 [Mycena rosella]
MHFGSQSPEPELARHHVEGTIFFYHDILQDICLQPEDLDGYPWCPQEPWSMFFEKRLCPAVYFLQAAVTHDFTLVGRKGIYGKVELEEINFWLSQILLHCRLLLLSRSDMAAPYLDDWAVPFPPDWEIPGEATAMFEILYRICMSVGFPEIDDPVMPVTKFTLLPLISEAHKTRKYNTPKDYHHYNEHGALVDPHHFHPERENMLNSWGCYPRAEAAVFLHDSGGV